MEDIKCHYFTPNLKKARGKTSAKEDRFTAKFVELIPGEKISQAIIFDSNDPALSGEMIVNISFKSENAETKVAITFTNIPSGINPKDNEAGTKLTLEKLAHYVEGKQIIRK